MLRGTPLSIESRFEDQLVEDPGYEPHEDEDFDGVSDELQDRPEDALERVFEEFVQKARAALPFPDGVGTDIYVGLWAQQESFSIPQCFFDFIAETQIPVVFDLND